MKPHSLFRLSVLTPAILAGAIAASCSPAPEIPRTADQRASDTQDLVVRGVAHAEIGDWGESIRRFEEAIEIGGDDPALAFDLGVALLRNGDLDEARANLERVGPDAPSVLAARTEYARGKLALETGDANAESSAYRRAIELDPSEPAYPYALSQVLPRLGQAGADSGGEADREIGALLERALRLWPDNARLAAEVAQWALAQPEADARRRALELLDSLAAAEPRIEPFLARGRAELAETPDRTPVSLRRALNLLRPGKRFQTDSAALDARLALLPLAELTSPELDQRSPSAPVEITLERSNLLPELPLVTGETVLDIVAFNDALGVPELGPDSGPREAHLAVLTDRSLWFLGQAADSFERLASLQGQRRLLVGELDGDAWMEVLVLGEQGVSAFGRSQGSPWRARPLDPKLASFRSSRSGILTDFEHDGDLDLLLLDDSGRLSLTTHRGESGLGPPETAPFESDVASALLASDLDGDADQDLVLVLEGGSLAIFANERQGDYRLQQELPSPGTTTEWLSIDYDADGRRDLAGIHDGRLILWRNRASKGFERDEESERRAAEALGTFGERARSLTIADVDRDAALDLVVTAYGADGAASLVALNGRFDVIASFAGLPPQPNGIVAVDLDSDGDPDPLIWNADGLTSIESSGGEARGRLTLSLLGLAGKVPLDARGTRLETWFGLDKYAQELTRPHVVVGLGGREPALVKVTWPNGISEYLFDPEIDSTHVIKQELRIEGSCPFLYASDGREMRFVTDILGLAPLGMLAAPGRYVPADPEEYLRLPDWVSARDAVELSITEELREVAYIDQSELVVVDAPPGVEIYNGERWFPGRVEGLDLRLLGPLQVPVSVHDARGQEMLEKVRTLDERYLAHTEGKRLYQGARKAGHLEIEIPTALARTDRVALVLTGWLHWGNTSTSVARGQDPLGAMVFPYLEVPVRGAGWQRVELDVGLPAGKTKPVVVDLAGLVDPGDPRVRITTDFEVYWDRIAVAETLPLEQTPHRVHRLAPTRAELSYGGFSGWYRPADNGPYLFDYADRRPYPSRPSPAGDRALSWQEHEGFYTDFGSVTDLVRSADDRLVVFGSGEELSLSFDTGSLPPLAEGWRRTLFLHSEGWEKDGDPNVACSQTVGPLPSREMNEHPCPESQSKGALENADRRGRWVDRDRLERRVLAWN